MLPEMISQPNDDEVIKTPMARNQNAEWAQPQEVPAPEALLVHYLPGRSKRLVVSLAGVGRARTRVPPMEFLGTASDDNTNHVLFISDTTRSWLNGPGITKFIIGLIARYRKQHDIQDLVLMGNSMGGFSALVLADLIPTDTVISFAPQFSANPDIVPTERRWFHFRKHIAEWKHPTVGSIQKANTNYFIFHGDDAEEIPHWVRFPQARNVHHLIVKGEGHNIARLLRRRNALTPMFRSAVDNKPRRVRKILELALNDDSRKVLRRVQYETDYPEVINHCALT